MPIRDSLPPTARALVLLLPKDSLQNHAMPFRVYSHRTQHSDADPMNCSANPPDTHPSRSVDAAVGTSGVGAMPVTACSEL